MPESGKLISEYQTAIRSMRSGKYDLTVQADLNDEVGKLGYELNELANQLERKFNEVTKLREISENVTAGLFLDDILSRAYESFRTVIPYNRMGCALLSDEDRVVTAYWERTDFPKIKLKKGYKAQMAGSSLQQILDTGMPRILNDLEDYFAKHPVSDSTSLLLEEGMRSSLTCPLIAQGKYIGFLFFTSNEKNTYRDIHQGVFLQIAGQISALIEKSRLYQQLYELNQKLIQAQEELQHQATHDVLTGLYNRRAIIDLLENQLKRAKRHNQALGIIMFDVDHFKQFNDKYGHLAGDAVLKDVAAAAKSCLRDYDVIGRYGGEEFLAVLGDTNYETATATAKRLIQAIGSEAVLFGSKQLSVTISAGVAVAGNCAELDADKIIAAADQELYSAKACGRNQIKICRI